MQEALEIIYKNKKTKGLDAATWKLNLETLYQAIEKGTGLGYGSLNYGERGYELITALRYNAGVFAAFKNHHEQAELIQALAGPDGEPRSFEAFRAEAESIYEQYNKDWLDSEYNTAIGIAQMALKWEDIQANADIFPMLRYEAVQDERTRSSHAKLHGTTLPIEDPFWEEYYPPNGWQCRCTVRQVAQQKEVSPQDLPSDKEVPTDFRYNAGKANTLFGEEHAYFQVNKETYERVVRELHKLQFDSIDAASFAKNSSSIPAEMSSLQKLAEKSILGLDKNSGGFVVVHHGHAMNREILKNELNTLAVLKKEGYGCILRDERGTLTIDLEMNGKLYEIKRMANATNPKERVRQHLDKAFKQEARNIVLDLQQDVSTTAIVEAIWASGRGFKEIVILRNGKIKVLNMALIKTKTELWGKV